MDARDSSGISLYYILFNLLVATEILALDLSFLTMEGGTDMFIHNPPSVGDWLNLAQFAIVCGLWVLMFVSAIAFYPQDRPHKKPITVSMIYVGYLFISLFPLLAVSSDPDPRHDRRSFDAVFTFFHIYLGVNHCITILGIAALIIQVRTIRGRPDGSDIGALSVVGLAAQAAVFFVVSFSWPWRLAWPAGRGFLSWITLVGFVWVDYLIFAVGQAALLYLARRHNMQHVESAESETNRAGEREPLLGNTPDA